jgi:UDP-N-acetylmuramate dehydrogenase
VRTGGNADYFARVGNREELVELLAWADEENLETAVVGSGSNLLVADAGVRGLVLKLESDLARIEQDDLNLICGGGARLPAAAAYSARVGLSGMEFGVNIPGTVGGAVKMNANAYGGELESVLLWVDIATSAGVTRRKPNEFEFRYRHSNLRSSEVVCQAAFGLRKATSQQVKEILADLRSRRKAAQPSGIKTFGSTFKNPQDSRSEGRTAGQLLEAAGCRGLQIGGAKFSDKHANFVENTGSASTSEILELLAEGQRRVREYCGIELKAEVQLLGDNPGASQLWAGATDS